MPPIKKKQKSNNNLPQKNDPQKSAEESNNNNIVRNIAKGKPSKTLCINPRVTAGNVTISGGTVYLRELNDKGYITENTVTIFVSSFGIAIFDFLNQLAGELSQPPRRLRIYRKIDELETEQFAHKWSNYGLISEQRGKTLAAMGVKDLSDILLEKQTTLDTWPTQKSPIPNSPYFFLALILCRVCVYFVNFSVLTCVSKTMWCLLLHVCLPNCMCLFCVCLFFTFA